MAYLSNPKISEVGPNAPGREVYVHNAQTMIDVTNILIQAADNRLHTASPAILAWSIILQTMTDRMLALETAEYAPDDRASSVDTNHTLGSDPYKEALEQINDIVEEDVIDYLARSAIDSCQVFDVLSSLASRLGNTTNAVFSNFVGAEMRGCILNLIRYSTRVGYNAEIVGASVAALTSGQDYWDIHNSDHIFECVDPVAKFWKDETLKGVLLQNAVWRFPFESMPFLELLRALAYRSSTPKEEPKGNNPKTETVPEIDAEIYNPKAITEILDVMPFFTYALPPNFVDYETTQEEENTNSIRLTKGIHLFVPRSYTLRSLSSQSSSLVTQNTDFFIPAGTIGRIVSESDPKVAYWYHQYSGFAYLGKLLETFLAASDLVDATTGQPADRDSVSEIIELFAMLISPAKSALPSFEAATDIVEKTSSGLSHDRDIIGVIFDIFQEELHNQSASSGADVPLDILVSCVHFIHALLPLYPARVWPLLTHSGLLDLGRGGGKLPVIVEGVELLSGKYDLLVSCCHLFESLVEDLAVNAIKRRSSNTSRNKARLTSSLHQSFHDVSTGIPESTASKIISSFARYLVEVLESSRTWKYNSQDDRRRIGKIIGTSFDKILNYTFGIEAPVELDPAEGHDEISLERALVPFSPMAGQNGEIQGERRTKIMEGLMLGASHIIESFLSASAGTLRFQPLLRSYFDGLETPETTVSPNLVDLWTGHVGSILSLSQTLLQVKTMLGLLPSQLESQIFKSSSLIARLYAAHDTYKTKVVGLFEALIVTASSDEASEPPSLLGHLGPHTARNFLHCLADLDKPLSRQDNLATIWHFLSMVMSSRQQWFANYLLTGKTPRDAMKVKSGAKDLVALDKPLLSTALDALSNINELPKPASLAMLEFVALAQNYWPWTVYNSPQYKDFIDSMQDFVGRLKPLGQSKDSIDGLIEDCYQTRISAYVAEILAMHLFHSRQTGTPVQLKPLITNLSYFKRFAAAVPDYKQSLHSHLKRNFEAKYPGSTIGDLKRTPLGRRQLGTEYFYDTLLADLMLSVDQGWFGTKANGLRDDVHRANVNLSLVDAQIVRVSVVFVAASC